MQTDCQHPDAEVVTVEDEYTFLQWCSLCGSICDNNGAHGAAAGVWRSPDGLVLPGWTCRCGIFNGSSKELLTECRSCGTPRLTTDTTQCTSG